MADGFTPVAQNIQAPQAMSLADVMNIARGAQAYQQAQQINPLAVQQAQQATATGQINLDVLTQQNKERLGLQDYFQNPDNWQTNGQLDMDKVNSAVPKIAPLTGSDYIKKLTDTQKAVTQAQGAMQDLDQSDRSMIASRFGVLGRMGVKDRDAYTKELDTLLEENPNNKNLAKVVKSYQSILSNYPEKSDAFPQLAIRAGQSMLDVNKQEELFGAKAGTLNTGAAVYPTTTQMAPGGAAPTISVGQNPLSTQQLGPGQRYEPTGRTDVNNNPTAYVRAADGTILGEVTIPGYQGGQTPSPGGPVAAPGAISGSNVARIPSGESAESGAALTQARQATNNAARNVPAIKDSINQVVDLADKIDTGKFGEAEANLASKFGFVFGSDKATNLQQMGHYLGVLSQNMAQQMGIRSTDAGAQQAEMLAGKTNWTADAIKSTANTIKAYNTGVALFNQGQEAYLANNTSQGIYAKRAYDNAWSANFNVDAMRLYNAAATGDKLEIDKAARELGGYNSQRCKQAFQSVRNLQMLTRGQLPSGGQ